MDERFFIYGSDLELCQRIWKDGRQILLEPSAAVFHHQSKGGTGSGNSAVRMWLQLDALYGYGLYFKQYRGTAYYSAYRTIVAFCLGFVAMQYWLLRKPARKIKWARLTGFLFNRNFRHFKV
jgi:GT2 family glycosyltransferase